MPMWARAIIFGVELVGFAAFCVIATIKFYMQDVCKRAREDVISNLRFNIIYFTINYAAILSLFLCSYPSFVFLSYSKLIMVSASILISIIVAMTIGFIKPKKQENRYIIFMTAFVFLIFLMIFGISGMLNIENKIVVSEQTETETITPTMFSENQIGYTADSEGNIKTYVFYYQGNNGVWEYEELKASEVKVEKIKDADTYIEKTVTRKSYCKQEKKPLKDDYITTEENEKYIIYLNLKQMVEIKTD